MDFHYVQISFTKFEYMNTSGSAIAEYLLNNHQCPMSYYESVFTVLGQLHSDFHLNNSETIFIKSQQPSLCKQKGWLLGLNIICLRCICIYWHIINICVYPIIIQNTIALLLMGHFHFISLIERYENRSAVFFSFSNCSSH